jgi:transposase-like protein
MQIGMRISNPRGRSAISRAGYEPIVKNQSAVEQRFSPERLDAIAAAIESRELNITRAAAELQMSRGAVHRWLKRRGQT